jgi:hypothetical protein
LGVWVCGCVGGWGFKKRRQRRSDHSHPLKELEELLVGTPVPRNVRVGRLWEVHVLFLCQVAIPIECGRAAIIACSCVGDWVTGQTIWRITQAGYDGDVH